MSYELEDISGIGKSIAEKMKAAGIGSIEKLATVKLEDLIKLQIKGVGKATAEKIITNAKKIFEEIGAKTKSSTVIKEIFILTIKNFRILIFINIAYYSI